jgi:hypothetical protein
VLFHATASPLDSVVLLHFGAAALNQYGQNNHNQHTGNNPNDQGTVHENSSFLSTTCLMRSQFERDTNGARCRAEIPGPLVSQPAGQARSFTPPLIDQSNPRYLTRVRRR